MKKEILILILSFVILFSKANLVLAQNPVPQGISGISIESKKLDTKAVILAKYLEKYNSPLQFHAQDFIDAANTFKLDWKLVVSIAGVESTFGKHIPGGFNGWGWGVYGTQAIYFSSWKDGIYTVSRGLREGYINKGLNDPYAMNRVYAASPAWGSKVTYFMNDLEQFAQILESQIPQTAKLENDLKIAAISGQLNSN